MPVSKWVLSTLLLVSVSSAFGQKQKVNFMTTFDDKRVHFGFTLGINTLDFAVSHYNPIADNTDFESQEWPLDPDQIKDEDFVYADVAHIIPGFTVGILSSLRLTKDLDLRFLPGLSFGERKLTYNIPVFEGGTYQPSTYYSIKSTYLDFPLLFKYKARRINNDRPYVVFGPAYRIDISRADKDNDLVWLKSNGFYAEVGAGWDHYFSFFRFSVEAKVSLGLHNQIGDPPVDQRKYYTQAIRDLRSNIFTLSFHFE